MKPRRGGAGYQTVGPRVGWIITGEVVGHAKRGVLIELGGKELVLPRTRYGAAADRIASAGYGDAVSVEVVADKGHPGGIGLSRLGIERSIRQPRTIPGRLERAGSDLVLAAEGLAPLAVYILDHLDVARFHGRSGRWLVGAPFGDVRFVLGEDRARPPLTIA